MDQSTAKLQVSVQPRCVICPENCLYGSEEPGRVLDQICEDELKSGPIVLGEDI